MLLVVSYAMSKFKLCLGIDQKIYVKCVSNTGNDLAFMQNFQKNKISPPPLICTFTCSYQGVRNDIFVEIFGYARNG